MSWKGRDEHRNITRGWLDLASVTLFSIPEGEGSRFGNEVMSMHSWGYVLNVRARFVRTATGDEDLANPLIPCSARGMRVRLRLGNGSLDSGREVAFFYDIVAVKLYPRRTI